MNDEQVLAEVRLTLAEIVDLSEDDNARLELESLELVEVVSQLEQHFGFTIHPGEITPRYFATLRAIATFVTAKKANKATRY